MGWTVNLIGANIDVDKMATGMNIRNSMAFSATPEGTREMWEEYNERISRKMTEYAEDARTCSSRENRVKLRKDKSEDFFI